MAWKVKLLTTRLSTPAPLDYATPPFPGLYWPYNAKPGAANYLYYSSDIWKFTFYWTLIVYGCFHLSAATLAVLMQIGQGKRVWRWVWAIPLAYSFIALVEALMAGSFVGLILGAVYNAGYFRLSTWIPFVWSLINVLVLILSSFSIQGGL